MQLRTKINPPRKICYVPHGIDEDKFFPITELHPLYKEMNDFNRSFLNGFNSSFVVFYNSRNVRRKMVGDVVLSYKLFCDMLPKEESEKCLLIMHTQPVDENGTDLPAVIDAVCPNYKILFSTKQIFPKELNYFYNLADVTINISSNEGWGLSSTESLMAGTPVIINVTGGLQDQARFEDENGNWIDFNEAFSSNHAGTYKKYGKWAFPIFPSNRALFGSPPTPYIFDDRCDFEDVSLKLLEVYKLGRDELKSRGLLGREWVISDESMMSTKKMGENFIKFTKHVLENWSPRERFSLINTNDADFTSKPNGIMISEKISKNR